MTNDVGREELVERLLAGRARIVLRIRRRSAVRMARREVGERHVRQRVGREIAVRQRERGIVLLQARDDGRRKLTADGVLTENARIDLQNLHEMDLCGIDL